MTKRKPSPWLLLLICALFSACGSGDSDTQSGKDASESATPYPSSHAFAMNFGGGEIYVQGMLSKEEQMRGLMYREELAQDHGMLFVFPTAAGRSFWMKNTTIPLDIGYFTPDGVLREVYPLTPGSLVGAKSKSYLIQFALEMNRGWFEENGVQPGAQLDLEAVKALITARGFPLDAYSFTEEAKAAK